jgi:hypothetical protein
MLFVQGFISKQCELHGLKYFGDNDFWDLFWDNFVWDDTVLNFLLCDVFSWEIFILKLYTNMI